MKIDTSMAQMVVDLGLAPITQGGHGQFDFYTANGRNADVDTSAEDIWRGGGTWLGPVQARIHDLVSSDADDTAAGAGARTVEIFGLDTNWNKQSETITLAGTSNVPTTLSYLHIYKMIVRTAGGTGSNEGAITATAQTDSTVTDHIAIGTNESESAIFPIRAGYTGHLFHLEATRLLLLSSANLDFRLLALPDGEVWQVKFTGSVSGGGSFIREYKVPLVFLEKTVVKMTALSSAINADVTAGFDILLIKN